MPSKTIHRNLPFQVSVIMWGYGRSPLDISACLSVILSGTLFVEILLGNDTGSLPADDMPEEWEKHGHIEFLRGTFPNRAAFWNRGIEVVRGEYIVLMDCHDRIVPESIEKLFLLARQTGADMLRGGLVCDRDDEPRIEIYAGLPGGSILTGTDSLISLLEQNAYYPTAYGYMYKREWVRTNLRFDENLVYPEEIWLIEAYLRANTVYSDNAGFYECRTQKEFRLEDIDRDGPLYVTHLFDIGDRIRYSADRESPAGNGNETLKSWLYVNACRIYAAANLAVSGIRTYSFELPPCRMPSDQEIDRLTVTKAREKCRKFCRQVVGWQNEFLAWRDNPCDPIISAISADELHDKRIILVYNSPAWQDYQATLQNLPPGYVLTLDRAYLDKAFAVVFHIPVLHEHLYGELEKKDGQIWIAWNMEPESKVPLLHDDTFLSFFDLRMDYHPRSDIVCPYYAEFRPERMLFHSDPASKKNRVCMLISSGVNQSRRKEYLAELMKYTPIDSYGRLYHNKDLEGEDRGWESKIALYSQYKFVIAFENSVLEDYVTEKLYDPLLAGTVPIYLGAPNVEGYLPGDNCIVRVDRFGSPEELAAYINLCYADNAKYLEYHRWRSLPWREDFLKKVAVQNDSPFVRLCWLLDDKYPVAP